MARPGANIFLSNGNLGIQAPGAFGTPALVMATPVAPTAGYLTAFSIKSKKQADTAFAAGGNAAVLAAIKEGFYAEAPEGTEIFIVCAVNTNSLTQLAAEAIAGKALDLANGKARLLSFVKFTDVSYVPVTTNGFDADVHTAVTAVQALAASWFAKRKPFRALVQGYGFTAAAAALDYSAAGVARNVGVVVGAVNDSTAIATLLALGRLSKEDAQRNIGRVKSGSLVIADTATVKIGATLVDKMDSVDLDTLHTKRYITFEKNETAPGYIFNDDNMCVVITDDYNNMRYGRVIDNVVRIAYESYYEELKEDVEVDAGGRLNKVVEKALETKIEGEIDSQIRTQLSTNSDGTAAVKCLVNPDPLVYATLYAQNDISSPNFNILQTNKVYIFVRARPKGCLKYIDIYLGYTFN